MSIRIPGRLNDRRDAIRVHADEVMRGSTGDHRIDRDLQTSFRTVLETDRHGKAARHLTMGLTLGGPGSDSSPTQQVGEVLGSDGIQQFGRAGYAFSIDVEQNGSGQLHPLGNVAGAVQVGVIDQAFPSHCRPGLFKVGAHDDKEFVSDGFCNRSQPVGILIGRGRVMDRAGSDNDDEALCVASVQDIADGLPGLKHDLADRFSNRQTGLDFPR